MKGESKREPEVGGFELEEGGAEMKPIGEIRITPLQKAWAALMTVIAIVALILAIVACTKTYTNDDYALKKDVVTAEKIKSDAAVVKNVNDITALKGDITALQQGKGNANDITALQEDVTALQQGKVSKEEMNSAIAKQGGIFLQTTDHGFPEAAFWMPVRDGYNDAAAAVGVTQNFQPGLGDLDTMKKAISNAGKTQVDGLVVSLWNTDLEDSVKVAINNNVPVISINSGIDSYVDFGIQVHIGQDETVAGTEVAKRMIEDLPSNFKWKALCVNHEGRKNVGTTQRCDAFEAEMQAAGHEFYSWHMDEGSDFWTNDEKKENYQNKIKEYVNNGYDAILTSTNDIAVLTYEAVEAINKKDEVDISTFDIDPTVTAALREGHLDFAVDQQAYLQGFLPIALLSLKVRYELMLKEGALLTGPYIVTGSKKDTDKYATRDYKNLATALKQPEDIRIAVVTHGRIEAGFWQVVQNGVKSAARDFGISVEYRHPTELSAVNDDTIITAMTDIVNEYVTETGTKIDGLVISIFDCGDNGGVGETFKNKIAQAAEAGIPVISINSGGNCYKNFGGALSSQKIMAHVGADEDLAGTTVGEWLASQPDLVNKKVLCVSHEPNNGGIIARCDGIQNALKAAWGSTYDGYNYFALTINGTTTETNKQGQIKNEIARLDMTMEDVIITHGPMTADTAHAASKAVDGPKVGTFDLSFGILESMAAGGKGLFCVDQQQFMQGYLPVMFHYLNARWGNGLPQQFVKTGPAMISDHTMATHLIRLVEDQIR